MVVTNWNKEPINDAPPRIGKYQISLLMSVNNVSAAKVMAYAPATDVAIIMAGFISITAAAAIITPATPPLKKSSNYSPE